MNILKGALAGLCLFLIIASVTAPPQDGTAILMLLGCVVGGALVRA